MPGPPPSCLEQEQECAEPAAARPDRLLKPGLAARITGPPGVPTFDPDFISYILLPPEPMELLKYKSVLASQFPALLAQVLMKGAEARDGSGRRNIPDLSHKLDDPLWMAAMWAKQLSGSPIVTP